MNFTRIHDEMAAMRLDLERGIRKLEELFPTKPAASTTPTPTTSTTTTASPTTTPIVAARTMEEEARIHNKLDRCIQMLRETRMGMEFLSSSASSTTSDISTTASSTTTLPPPPPAAPTSTATTRAHSQTLPTRCSTPGPEHALAFANAGMATSSISSCTPIAASTSPLPPTTAAPTSTPAQAVLEVEKDVFTTTPTRCLTTRSSHDSMHKLEKTLNKCYPFEIVQHRYTNSSPASSFDEVLPTARGWDAHDGISVKKSVSDTFVDKGQGSYILKFEQVWIHPKPPWPIVCLVVVRFWSQFNFGWVTGQQRPPWPPPINSKIQDAGVPFRPPPWPFFTTDLMAAYNPASPRSMAKSIFGNVCTWYSVTWKLGMQMTDKIRPILWPSFTGHTTVVCIVNQLMMKYLMGDISGECLHPGVELYGTVMQIYGIKGKAELQFSSSITGKFWDADVFKRCSQLPFLCNTLWQYAVGKQLQVSIIQWAVAWRFAIDGSIFSVTNLIQEPANVLRVTSINLASSTTTVRKHVIVLWRCENTKLKGHIFTVGVQVRMLSNVERTTLATVCLSLLLVWCCNSEVQYHVPFPFQVCTSLLIEMNGNRLLKYWVVISWQRSWECFSSSLARSISPGLQYFGYALGKPSQPCNMLQAPPIINEFVIAQLKRGGSRAGIAQSSKCQNELATDEISGMRNGFQYLQNTVQMQQHLSFWLSSGVTDYQQVILCNPELGLHTTPHVSDRRRILNLACCSSKHMLLCVTVSPLFQNNVTFLSQRAWQISWSVSMDASSQKLLPYQHGHEVAFLLSLLMKLSGPITLHSHIFTNGISIKLLSEVGNTIHIKLCSSLLFPWRNDVWNQRELHESFKYQCGLEVAVGSIGCNESVGGQARLKFVLQPEEARHCADTGCRMGLHHRYIMKINYKVQVIWVLLSYSQAIEDP